MRSSLLCMVLSLPLAAGCGGGDERQFSNTGGADAGATGGSSATGGGGSGGGAGSGGTAGSSGSAGTGAAAGASGSAGTAGTGGTAGSSGSAGSGGASPCGSGKSCIPTTPAGWSGPVTVGKGASAPPGCPSTSYGTSVATLKDTFVPGAASCTCNCGSTTVTCGNVSYWDYTSNSCGGLASFVENLTPVSQCKVTNNALDKQIRVSGSASCLGETVTKTLPTPTWASQVRLCGGVTDSGGCGSGQACIADAPSGYAGVCVFRVGDFPCPSGYPNRTVYYEDFTDTRDCTSCSCAPSGWNCNTNLTPYQSLDCTDTAGPKASVKTSSPRCTNQSNMTAFKVSVVTKTAGSCGVTSNTSLTGAAAATKPQTVCCR